MLSKKSNKNQSPARRRAITPNTADLQPARKSGFKKNRTLTGSRSSQVQSSNEFNSELLSPRAHAHHLSKKRNKIVMKLVLIIGLILTTYLLVSMLIAQVSVRRSSNDYTISASKATEYENQIDAYLSSSPLQRFHPSLNEAALLTYLQKSHPEISSSSIELSGDLGKTQAIIGVRKPVARWTINGKDEFVDKQGVVFSYNAYATPPIEIQDRNKIAASSENIVASSRFLAFVGTIVGDMREQGYTVTKASIPPLTTRQIEIQLKGVSHVLKMTIERSVGEQTEDAVRITKYLQKKSLSPKYVDVRVQGRAFYK